MLCEEQCNTFQLKLSLFHIVKVEHPREISNLYRIPFAQEPNMISLEKQAAGLKYDYHSFPVKMGQNGFLLS